MRRFLPRIGAALLALVLPWLGGCSTLAYYRQAALGHWSLMRASQPIVAVIDDPATPAVLREQLQEVQRARQWASEVLGLPANASYARYADIGREAVVWNLFATPELSLDAHRWCYPLLGCLAYRGFYAREDAVAAAQTLREQGWQVHVAGVSAYSTLGWFDDPLLNTMLGDRPEDAIGTVFHELTHQLLYVSGDTAFNESYASFVEQEGLRQYRESGALVGFDARQHQLERQQRREFVALVLELRADLDRIYRSAAPDADRRAQRDARFARFADDYERLKRLRWGGWGGFDRWFERGWNNAMLLPFGLYDAEVPAFAQLFEESGQEWAAFHAAVRRLGRLGAEERGRHMSALAARAAARATSMESADAAARGTAPAR